MKLKSYPKYKDAGLPWIDQIPEHWNVLPNRAVFEERNTRGMGREELLSVTIKRGVLRQKELIESSSKKDSSNEDKSKYKLVLEGDLPYNKMRMWQGAVGVSKYRGIVSPAYIILRPRKNVYSDYYHYLLRTPEYIKESYRYSYGICDDQLSLRFKDFKVIKSIVPPIEEQKIIVQYLRSKEKKIAKFISNKRRLIQLLKEQKQAIINQAVTRGTNPDVKLKPSGIDWIGDIPEHWKIMTLRRCCKAVKTGTTPKGADAKFYSDNGLDWYTPGDFSDDIYLGDSMRQLSQLGKEAVTLFPAYTIMIIGIGGTIGKVCISKYPASCNQQINAIIVKPHVNVEYFTYYLRTLKEYITKCGKFTTLPIINQDETKDLIVLLPSIAEQKDIALGINMKTQKINETISKIEQEIKLIQEYRTRLISDVVTGKVDVRDIKLEDVADEETIDDLDLSEDEQELGDSVEEVLDEE